MALYIPMLMMVILYSSNSTILTDKINTPKLQKNLTETTKDNNVSKSLVSMDIVQSLGEFKTKLFGDLEKNESAIKSYWFPTGTKGLDSTTSFFRNIINNVKANHQLIFPGTLWCGDGDVADSDSDVGPFILTDTCCKAHDHCVDYMKPGEKKYELTNTGLFARFDCRCDMILYRCLSKTRTFIADMVGFVYFDILSPQCYRLEYPILDCKNRLMGRCVKYAVDPSEPKRIQWFDNPNYSLQQLVEIEKY